MNYHRLVWIIVFIVLGHEVMALSISLENPSNNTFFNNRQITFLYTPHSSENISGCCLFINNNLQVCNQNAILNVQNSFNNNLSDGMFVWNVNCSDDNQSEVSADRLFVIDTLTPVISILNPRIGSWQRGIISVKHTESDTNIKECSFSYGTSAWTSLSCNATFDFDTTKCVDGMNSCVLQIKALDMAGNQNTQLTVFSVDNKYPTASISLSGSSPVKEGTVEVTLQASEDLQDEPSLEYSLDNSPDIRQPISLTGSGTLWKGYMIIGSYGIRVGTFYFNGVDVAGNNGTLITSGKLFLIDTEKPIAPSSIKLTRQDNGDIRIAWYYDGKPFNHFIIYRSTDGNVDYVDQYATSQTYEYLDTSVDNHETYYYRVSAIDAAGNNGALSSQVSISPAENEVIQADQTSQIKASPPEQSQQTTPETQPQEQPTLKESDILSKDLLNEINKLSVDVSWVISNFQNKDDVVEKYLITDLELMVQASNAQQQVEDIRKQILDLQSSTQDEDAKMKQLNMIQLQMKKVQQITPRNIVVQEKNEFIQSITNDDIKNAVDELIGNNKNFSLLSKNDFKDKAILIQPQVNVNTEADSFTIEYLDKSKYNKTLVTKKLVYQSPETLQNVVLVEFIPKNVADSINSLDVKTTEYEILKEDPVLMWRFATFNYEEKQIKYIINDYADMANLKGIKSIILTDPVQYLADKESTKISGFSIFTLDNGSGIVGKSGLISIIIGFVIVIMLAGYYLIFIRGSDNLRFPMIRRFSKSELLKKQIKDKLQEAHDYLEIEDYQKAMSVYPKIKYIYDKLSKQEKSELYSTCAELYTIITQWHKK